MRSLSLRSFAMALCGLLLVSCSDGPPAPPPAVSMVDVSLGSTTLLVGASTTANAVARASNGSVLSGRSVSWTTSAPSVATIDATGGILGVGPGSATISASIEGKIGSAQITVSVPPVASISLSLATTSIIVNATTQATVVLRDAAGVTLTGRTITWSSSAPQVATISDLGTIQGVAPGTSTITATSEGQTATALVTVLPIPIASVTVTYSPTDLAPGRTAQATATLRDISGAILTGRAVVWTSSTPAVATVTSAGSIAAVSEGTTVISATSEGVVGSVQVVVSAPKFAIAGTVPGQAGVTIRAAGPVIRSVVTGADGSFRIEALPVGDYTVSPIRVGAVFQPVDRLIALRTQDATGVGFAWQAPSEGILASVMAQIDSAPETPIAPDAVILPNGKSLSAYLIERGLTIPPLQHYLKTRGFPTGRDAVSRDVTGPQQRKNDIVARMVASAQNFSCARTNPVCTKWDFPADPLDMITKPAQTGLTYIWGGKNPYVRTKPGDGCPEMTYGVDCSGLISRIAENAGLVAPAGSANQSNPAAWSLPAAWQLQWKKVDNATIETGDLVAWPGHIGIAQSSGAAGTVAVISSTGSPGDCQRNISPPRGPRSLTVQQLRLGTPTTVLRLVTTLSGTFDLFLRCVGQTTDAAVIRFQIDNDNGGSFQASGNGVDYDGTPFTATLNGTYEPITNTVNARISVPSFGREDSFSLKLLQDDSGYFTMTKVINNGGCVVSGRLLRIPTPSTGAHHSMAPLAPPTAGTKAGPRLGGPR